jgi:hypothetical protein
VAYVQPPSGGGTRREELDVRAAKDSKKKGVGGWKDPRWLWFEIRDGSCILARSPSCNLRRFKFASEAQHDAQHDARGRTGTTMVIYVAQSDSDVVRSGQVYYSAEV